LLGEQLELVEDHKRALLASELGDSRQGGSPARERLGRQDITARRCGKLVR
jgi:hypothetical protein